MDFEKFGIIGGEFYVPFENIEHGPYP